jgi:hypothetical protein
MKKIVPFGFKKGSGFGWRYTWHQDDPKDEFRFECNECIYAKIPGKRNLIKLGTMCCHADISRRKLCTRRFCAGSLFMTAIDFYVAHRFLCCAEVENQTIMCYNR